MDASDAGKFVGMQIQNTETWEIGVIQSNKLCDFIDYLICSIISSWVQMSMVLHDRSSDSNTGWATPSAEVMRL